MCGIVGVWNLDKRPIDKAEFDVFADSLAHRGPDGRGVYLTLGNSLALGHRRLAIFDLSLKGAQPMSFGGDRYKIVYNGELYNFLELRKELNSLGYIFATETDTEVIVASYMHWGEDCQLKFNGMWAFCIWDEKNKTLFLSRDRFGIKPLYYYTDNNTFIFASELKAFLALKEFKLDFDSSLVSLGLTRYIMVESQQRSLLRGVKKLLPGNCLLLNANNSFLIRKWWNTYDHLVDVPVSYDDQVAMLRDLFISSCDLRMRSDVPIGTCLSGGLDSSSVLCSMGQISKETGCNERTSYSWRNAFVARYPGTLQDESAYADEVIRATSSKAYYSDMIPSDFFESLEDIIYYCESISDIPFGPWFVYANMSQNGVNVSLDGHAGDELLVGYHMFIRYAMQDGISLLGGRRKYDELKSILESMYVEGEYMNIPSYSNIFKEVLLDKPGLKQVRPILRWVKKMLRVSPLEIECSWLKAFPTKSINVKVDKISGISGHLAKALYRSFHDEALPTNLHDFDRMSMAHGVEVKMPFL